MFPIPFPYQNTRQEVINSDSDSDQTEGVGLRYGGKRCLVGILGFADLYTVYLTPLFVICNSVPRCEL
jgi:hypothetical protein